MEIHAFKCWEKTYFYRKMKMRVLRNLFGIALLEGKLCRWEFILHHWGSKEHPQRFRKYLIVFSLEGAALQKEEMLTSWKKREG